MTDEVQGEEMTETAFSDVRLFNQHVWDADPKQAASVALDAIIYGGFGEDCIRRKVGGYEGQIMAIRRGWVAKSEHGWRITDAGMKALAESGRPVPTFLPVLDGWHNSLATYCAWTEMYKQRNGHDHGPYLKLAKEVYGAYGQLAMHPLLSVPDVIALRDFLNGWIAKNEPKHKPRQKREYE